MIRPECQSLEWFEDGPLEEEELDLCDFNDLESALEYLLDV